MYPTALRHFRTVLGVMGWWALLPIMASGADEMLPVESEPLILCAQVITPAFNPNTKECREFPTPCDVPKGWVEAWQGCPPSKAPSKTSSAISKLKKTKLKKKRKAEAR